MAAPTPEERIKLLIGELHFQVAFLNARLDEALAKIATLELQPGTAQPSASNGADRDVARMS